ncbi:2Fe-2S iron-sulfur cluster-binding protein [Streptomyces sp. NRRL S-1813]|uniref:2Fe-2S iron-sulfur cluster-binding protein n=1 Tax=Streptomyces sp. NRRL S-1813 TaxID=1463888 RepID=UPI001F19C320|nr:2Fe-2S iron-sulfur cluster-binding protein [Streptomyces sp. NRRL S-1813]
MTAPWSPAHASLLDLAEACDIPTRWSCRTGVCHTCITHLVAGDITYTTQPLELPEGGRSPPPPWATAAIGREPHSRSCVAELDNHP